ncbi:MAG: MerR family DNA-binding transcriptional regulator [Nitrospirota bacterium]|nr:MAG: MerR family DNA-binding transcriptional regulator [Nitrospirota bacterium]
MAKFTGLSAHTIRKWEERYQLLTPIRSANGYRLYFEDDIQLLMYLNSQIGSGNTIGHLVKIGSPQLRHEMKEGPIQVVGLPGTHHDKAMTLIQAARRLDRSLAESIIQTLVDRLGLERAIQQIFFPVLKAIGELWHHGQISITGEHIASQGIRRHLVKSLPKRSITQGQRVVIACGPQDFHEFGAMAATLVLRNNGWQPIYLGTDSGIDMIRIACKRRMAGLIIISIVREPSKVEFTKILKQITKRLLPLCPVIVGGQGAAGFKREMEQSGITYFQEFNQIKTLKPQTIDHTHSLFGIPS